MTDEYAFRYAPKDVKAASTYICLESGQAADVTSVKMIHLAVLQSLHHLGMLQNISKAGLSEGLLAWQHFEISERFSLDQRGFQWVNGHGAYNFQVVPPGEVYGVRGEEKLRAPKGREPLGEFSASCQESHSYSDYTFIYRDFCYCYFDCEVVYFFYFAVMMLFYGIIITSNFCFFRQANNLRSYMVFPKVRELWAEGKPLGWLAWKLKEEEL